MKYAFEVKKMKANGHEFWVADSKELKGCTGQGETMEEAIDELRENEIEWLETAEELGIKIPTHSIEEFEQYSGKFVVRVSPLIHKQASENAKKEGISLNQYVNNALMTKNVAKSTVEEIAPVINEIMDTLLSRHETFKTESIMDYNLRQSNNEIRLAN